MKKGRMSCDKGRSLIWALSQLRCMIESEAIATIEGRLEQLAARQPHTGQYTNGALLIEDLSDEQEPQLPN